MVVISINNKLLTTEASHLPCTQGKVDHICLAGKPVVSGKVARWLWVMQKIPSILRESMFS